MLCQQGRIKKKRHGRFHSSYWSSSPGLHSTRSRLHQGLDSIQKWLVHKGRRLRHEFFGRHTAVSNSSESHFLELRHDKTCRNMRGRKVVSWHKNLWHNFTTVATPCLDDRQLPKNDFETMGEGSKSMRTSCVEMFTESMRTMDQEVSTTSRFVAWSFSLGTETDVFRLYAWIRNTTQQIPPRSFEEAQGCFTFQGLEVTRNQSSRGVSILTYQ